MKKTVCLFSSLILLLSCLTACGGTAPASVEAINADITVWYVDNENPMWNNFTSMLRDYNNGEGAAVGVKVTAKGFDSDEELLEALSKTAKKPALVVCGYDAAMSMGGDDFPVYTDLSFSTVGLSGLTNEYVQAGRLDGKLIAVPLAAAANVVMVNTALASKTPGYSDEAFASPEGICAAAVKYTDLTGQHFFTSDSFASLMSIGLAQLGGQFHAQKELDIKDENYAYLYNLLAEAAYDGGVTASDEEAVSLVAEGKMACAVVSSADIMADEAHIDASTTAFFPNPVAENGKKLYTMELCEMVITSADNLQQKAAANFMNWLISGSYALTDGTGYFPAASSVSASVMGGDTGSELYKALTAAVRSSAQKCALYFPAADSQYYASSMEFEENFRDTLSGLN